MRATSIVSLAGSALLLAAAAGSASAAPVSSLGKLELLPASASGGGAVEQVHWRRHHHWRHRGWGRSYSFYGYSGCWWRYGRRYCSW